MENEFSQLLSSAIAGNVKAMEWILEMYAPLINSHSYIDGRMDEDLRQYIIVQAIIKIRKFTI